MGASRAANIKPEVKPQHQRRNREDLKMRPCSGLIFCCLLITVISFRVQHTPGQYIDSSHQVRVLQRVDRPAARLRHRQVKMGAELISKQLRLDELSRVGNEVMEPKRKRSFPGNNAPLDRLSVSSMETKQTPNKQSKVVELPRRRVSPPPIDRIGVSRLPMSRG